LWSKEKAAADNGPMSRGGGEWVAGVGTRWSDDNGMKLQG
jgi:hypothetical protein